MKIKEFIEKVNEHDGMRAKKVYKRIAIGTPNNMGIFSIPEDATNFIEIDTWATSNSLYWKKEDREYLSALIEELLHTPVEERFPEKKYRLRWIDDHDHYKNYLNLNSNGVWDFVDDEIDAEIFTESELEQLKTDNPHLAPAIDAMKEEV
ncbi:hypothetical protein NP061_008465 [Weissella confusa]|uniref:Uncharacterized protein n=1 Tax=Limosilactobacillus reuteri TaxID=1598 RepID=A0A2T5Q485_LIMRT|nr:hypothetical protein [Limosilactobacillus reuteri]MCW3764377.1 hypothetical protein [Weissella confusa]PTV04272.1 hypothetical protein DB325_04285 [Limosilactobacillus reuteri]